MQVTILAAHREALFASAEPWLRAFRRACQFMTVGKSLPRLALELAETQHGVVARRQLLAQGIPARTIANAGQRLQLFPIYAGVYLVGRPQLSEDGLMMASLLAAGPGSVLGGSTAATIWGFLNHRNPVEVFSPRFIVNRRALLRVEGEKWWPYLVGHECAPLSSGDVRDLRGLGVTSPARSLRDSAVRLSKRRLRIAFMEADCLELLDDDDLKACAEQSLLSTRSLMGTDRIFGGAAKVCWSKPMATNFTVAVKASKATSCDRTGCGLKGGRF